MSIPLEDNFDDVLRKALRGLALSGEQLAQRAGLPSARVRALLAAEPDETALRAVAAPLGLDADALVELAGRSWHPRSARLDGLAQFNTPWPAHGPEHMRVNAYLAWDTESRIAVAIDAGAQAEPLLEHLRCHGLTLAGVLLTHTHADHVAALDHLLRETGRPPVWVHANEPLAGAQPVAEGARLTFGGLSIEARLTPGHSPGGTTWVVRGLPRLVALTGDALFCCSVGGVGPGAYAGALAANRNRILSLPGDTLLGPGHGPVTTVAEEWLHNPFFAGKALRPA